MKIKVNAKINLTLDILQKKGGYHLINSLCSPINLCDIISVKKRKDNIISVKEKGVLTGVKEQDNNAYKAAKLFMQTFKTKGVDIVIKKGIIVGAGLGGSSADIAGVLIAMKRLFKIKESIYPLAEKLGSDVSVMIYGSQAVITGRGEVVTPVKEKVKLNALLIYSDKSVRAKDAYERFDSEENKPPFVTDKVINKIERKDKTFILDLSNALERAVSKFNLEVKENINSLKSLGADNALMTGSGSAVYGIFSDKKLLKKAYKKLKPTLKGNIKIIKTL